jgi:hypothetical protein
VLNGFEKIVRMIYRESKPLDRSLIPEEHLDVKPWLAFLRISCLLNSGIRP